MLSKTKQRQLDYLYATVADDLTDEAMMDLREELDCMDLEDQIEYLMELGDMEDEREEEDEEEYEEEECSCSMGCNYCLMTPW